MPSKFTAVTLLVAICLTPIAPASSEAANLDEIRERGKLVMLCFPHLESDFARPNLERGPTRRVGNAHDFEGIDVDLIAAFAEHLGVDLEIHTLEIPGYAPLLPALLEGQADLVASTLSITEERKKSVEFSAPYFTLHRVIIADRESQISSVGDLAGRTAVVIPGSSHEETLAELDVPKLKVYPVEFSSEYLGAITDGEADFAVTDSTTAARNLDDYAKLHVAFRLPGEDHYGVAFAPGGDLREAFDRFLAQVSESGELERLIRGHLKRRP